MRTRRVTGLLSAVLLLCASGVALAQNVPPEELKDKPKEKDVRPTGLPTKIDWTFNFDAGWGSFGFGNSLFNNPKEDVPENLSDQWLEGYIKAGLTGVVPVQIQRAVRQGERRWRAHVWRGARPGRPRRRPRSSSKTSRLAGARAARSRKFGENAVDVSVGRIPYRLGHGLLIWDGASEGGSRGGYWTNARKAFAFGTVGHFKVKVHTIDAFYLDKDELPEADSGSKLWGLNYEVEPKEETTIGVTYLKTHAKPEERPTRDGMNVFNLRGTPRPSRARQVCPSNSSWYGEQRRTARLNGVDPHRRLSLQQRRLEADVLVSLRRLRGDDPTTPKSEAFDSLLVGFSDWGSWWQGEIAGEYFLSNSNLNSHMIRAHFEPTDKIGSGVIYYDFRLDKPAAYGPTVTDNHAATEIDWYTDWKLNSNILVSFVLAFGNPGKAVEQSSGRTENFRYGMVYIAYSF